jgi:tRNA1(Val) A37 N6-methylase TrmN6
MQPTLNATAEHERGVSAHIIHSDFRDLQAVYQQNKNADQDDTLILRPDQKKLKDTHPNGFDLVTGTPPYFRVDFQLESTSSSTSLGSGEKDAEPQERVTRAVIRQGGMPTAIQSARRSLY